jgi:hypothetical protein
MGEARFTCSQPWPRSIARLTPKPNSEVAITPKHPMVASMYTAPSCRLAGLPEPNKMPNST